MIRLSRSLVDFIRYNYKMELDLEPGVYVVAVSGGVDSVVLLNMLSMQPGLRLIVAHYDHGIREDSSEDRHFVDELAKSYHLPFVYDVGNLGPSTSEATARKHRYEFLHHVKDSAGAKAIITAHHEDDLLETVVMNVLRGTGRKGLSPLRSYQRVKRPLLGMSKKTLVDFAKARNLQWREDSTNQDTKYLRNYLRHKVMPNMTREQRTKLLEIAREAEERNQLIDSLLTNHVHVQPSTNTINKQWFIGLSHMEAREFLTHWLRLQGISFDNKTIERLVVQLKTLSVGSLVLINQGYTFMLTKHDIRMQRPQSV